MAKDRYYENSTTTTNNHNYADNDIYKEVLKATTIENESNNINDDMHINDDDDLKGEMKTNNHNNEDNRQNDIMSLNSHNSSKIDFNDIDYDNNPIPYADSNDSGNDIIISPAFYVVESSEESTNKKIHACYNVTR